MICKRIPPCPQLSGLIREYVFAQFVFTDLSTLPPLRAYPANPEEAIRFLIRGKLFTTNPATGITTQIPTISLIGQPTARQNLQITHEYLMIYIRFQPGSLFKLLHIPMPMFTNGHIDASAVMGKEITEVYEQIGSCDTYDAMISILDKYFLKKLGGLTNNCHPIDNVGRMILQNPQGFVLEKIAKQACLSYKQFEKRFEQLTGVTPKYYARICRFYQAFELKEYHPTLDWLSIALTTGYTDYQHLAKDFKEFAATTPTTLIKESLNSPSSMFPSSSGFRGV